MVIWSWSRALKLAEKHIYLWLLDSSLMDSAHALYTRSHTRIHTPIYCSFSQKGRICCQHIILLPLLFPTLLSSISMWNAFEDDKLLFLRFALCKTSPISQLSLVQSDQPSHPRMQRCAGCTEPRFWLQALWLALQLATRLSGLTLPQPQSVYLYFISYHSEKKRLRMVAREKVKASGCNSDRYCQIFYMV